MPSTGNQLKLDKFGWMHNFLQGQAMSLPLDSEHSLSVSQKWSRGGFLIIGTICS